MSQTKWCYEHLEICLQVLYETSLNVKNYQPGKAWILYSYFPEIKYEYSAHASNFVSIMCSFSNLYNDMWLQNSILVIRTWPLVLYIATHYALLSTDVRDLEKYSNGLTSIDTCYVDAIGSKVKGTNA